MTQTTTENRARLYNVIGTVLSSKNAVNSNGKPFVTARLKLANGKERTAMTYKADMMALLGNAAEGSVVRLYGAMERNVFSPIGVSTPREAVQAAA